MKLRYIFRYKIFLFCSVLTMSFVLAGVSSDVFAGSSTLSLEPAVRAVNKGDIFQVAIQLDTGGDEINTVAADLQYPSSKLSVTSIDFSGSPFQLVFPPPACEKGTNRFWCTVAKTGDGVISSNVLVYKVGFQAIDTGTASIDFVGTSATYRVKPDARDNLGRTVGGTITINAESSVTPTPTPIPPTPTTGPGTPTPTWNPEVPTPTPTPIPPTPTTGPGTPTPTWNPEVPTPTPPSATPTVSQSPTPTPTNPDLPDGAVTWPTAMAVVAGAIFIIGGARWLKFLV